MKHCAIVQVIERVGTYSFPELERIRMILRVQPSAPIVNKVRVRLSDKPTVLIIKSATLPSVSVIKLYDMCDTPKIRQNE